MLRSLIFPAALALLLAGCSDDTEPEKDSGTTPKDAQVDKAVVDTGPVPDKITPDMAKYAQVCGTTEDQTGIKLTNHPVIVCNDHIGCFSDNTSSTGTFCVSIDEKGEYVAHATATTRAGKNYTDLYYPVTVTQADIDGEKKIDAGKMVVPYTAKALQKVDVPKGGTFDLGGGVTLTVGAGVTKKPPLMADVQLGAAVLTKAQVNARSGKYYSGSGSLHMAVVFYPIETTFTSPVAFKFPANSLTAGSTVEVYFMSEKDGKLTKMGEAKESGGSISSVSGQGLKNLGVMLVYTK